MDDFKRQSNEDENSYIFRICENKYKIGTWQDVCNILNKELDHDYNESWYRKMYQSFITLFSAVKDKYYKDEDLSYLEEKIFELKKEKVKIADEKNKLGRFVKAEAKIDKVLESLENNIKSNYSEKWNPYTIPTIVSENDVLVMLSDLHFGSTFDNFSGKYNSQIAQERINKYLVSIISIAKRHNAKNCYLSLQGDLISGSIHKRVAILNKENIIEQIIGVSKLISEFIYGLAPIFENVYIYSVDGNHSRLDIKDDSLHAERLDYLITWYLKASLDKLKNVYIKDNVVDNSISILDIRGKKYVSVHGDFDRYSKKGVSDLSTFLGFIPYAVLFGHLHECSFGIENGIHMIRSGCLCGTGDDYTIEKRLIGKASQMVCVCNTGGVSCLYPVVLEDD